MACARSVLLLGIPTKSTQSPKDPRSYLDPIRLSARTLDLSVCGEQCFWADAVIFTVLQLVTILLRQSSCITTDVLPFEIEVQARISIPLRTCQAQFDGSRMARYLLLQVLDLSILKFVLQRSMYLCSAACNEVVVLLVWWALCQRSTWRSGHRSGAALFGKQLWRLC